ncbi:LysM peptidoglycan-binding domain-containing protein [Fretibacter rubidus]|uniref:LysM peptidoglycan-binding domain-containing protein n=1 Tax=Fretibacter rubidus TaxID=570162 RepID=UPI00352BCC3A
MADFAFNGGQRNGIAYQDFDQSYQPINSFNHGSIGEQYTVRSGDNLASIAANLYGDAALWSKITDANCIASVSTALFAGQALTLRAGVVRKSHDASTF